MSPPSTLAPVRPLFRAVARAVVPSSGAFDEARWGRAEAIVEEALGLRPASVRRQVALFLRLVGLLARLRTGRSLPSLPPDRARAVLGALERAPLLLLRRGVWGVRTLAFMGCYGQTATRAEIGYRAEAGGWVARGGGQGPWSRRAGRGGPEPTTLVERTAAPGPEGGNDAGGETSAGGGSPDGDSPDERSAGGAHA